MKYFKNTTNQIFAYEDDCNHEYISKNLVKISETEAIELTKTVLTVDEIKLINESKQQQLLNEANAEIDILNRAVRLRRASDLDKKRLELLENYTIDLYELDLNNINVNFPEMP